VMCRASPEQAWEEWTAQLNWRGCELSNER
jgi:hypothetical protein